MRAPIAITLLFASGVAHAYDFEIEARSVGQGYQLRWFRFSEPDRLLNRRRFTQTLRLHIWDILSPAPDPGYPDRPSTAPFRLRFTSSMRFDHDFGGFTQGDTTYLVSETMSNDEAAIAAVPELANQSLELDVLYAYLGAEEIGGFLDVQLGRQLGVGALEWFAFDGLLVRARTPWRFAIEALGGLVVRDSSIVASPAQEPDGTSSAHCFVFDPDAGSWGAPPNFVEQCDQRDALMPTAGLAVEAIDLRAVQARVAYRRAWSSTADGIYPGGTPSSATNSEQLAASVRLNLWDGGVVPWGAARWNFLYGQIDEANAGVRLGWKEIAVTPEVVYSFPSFDGDSIFNVFSTEPYHDLRLTWDVWPARGPFRGYARAFYRRFAEGDDPAGVEHPLETRSYVVGGGIGGRLRGRRARLRLDLFYEDGFGGLRAGGDASGRIRLSKDLEVEGRVTTIVFDEDLIEALDGVTFGAQGGARWQLGEGIALHLLLEENVNRFHRSQFRVIGILDLAFRPEL